MRLDHLAYRVACRMSTSKFFAEEFGYKIVDEFDLNFADGSTTECIAMQPPEKIMQNLPMTAGYATAQYHMAPEIFISDGSIESIVGQWVALRNNTGGIHHLAYEVKSVQAKMDDWGVGEFASDKPLECPGLIQVFTKPHPLTGMIYEFIERTGAKGFCKENVANLMESTKDDK